MATTTDFYRSENGDRWQLIRDDAAGTEFVRHEPNLSSGGQTSDVDVAVFLERSGDSPQRRALLTLLDTGAAPMA
jgi:hypothetical protein